MNLTFKWCSTKWYSFRSKACVLPHLKCNHLGQFHTMATFRVETEMTLTRIPYIILMPSNDMAPQTQCAKNCSTIQEALGLYDAFARTTLRRPSVEINIRRRRFLLDNIYSVIRCLYTSNFFQRYYVIGWYYPVADCEKNPGCYI